jgi:hypothetical protein
VKKRSKEQRGGAKGRKAVKVKRVPDASGYGYCRFATERMMRMHRRIEDKEYPNSRTFAREFEVSVRTVKRDIDFASSGMFWGFFIEWDRGLIRRGGKRCRS